MSEGYENLAFEGIEGVIHTKHLKTHQEINEYTRMNIQGSTVKVDIRPNYTGNSVRPSSIDVDYWIDGEKIRKLIPNP